jgi:hypothetical protein
MYEPILVAIAARECASALRLRSEASLRTQPGFDDCTLMAPPPVLSSSDPCNGRTA